MYQFLGNKTFDVSEDIKEHEHRITVLLLGAGILLKHFFFIFLDQQSLYFTVNCRFNSANTELN